MASLVLSWAVWRPSRGVGPQPHPALQKVPYLCRSLVRVSPKHFHNYNFHSWLLEASVHDKIVKEVSKGEQKVCAQSLFVT